MRVGVNWTPRAGWFHAWYDLDLDEVRRDFDQVAGLGLDHVRIFPLWPLLQPSRTSLRPRALADLVRVLDAARSAGLQVAVDALNGHLSSFEFLPSWAVTYHELDLFTDERAVAGERQLVSDLAGVLAGHPAVMALGLGNEFTQFASPRHTPRSSASTTQMGNWLDTMTDAARASGVPVNFSHDDELWFLDDFAPTPRHAVTMGDVTTVHSWIFTGVAHHHAASSAAGVGFARYLCELARAWSPDPSRPLWLQEVGAPRPWVDDPADFVTRTLQHVVDMPGLEAVTWWCSHDVSRNLPDFPELEYSLGLFDAEGRAKPEAAALADMVPVLQGATPTDADRPTLGFVADWETGRGRSSTAPGSETFRQWARLLDEGTCARLGRSPETVGRAG